MRGLDLRLPASLVPGVIRTQQPISLYGEYFLAITQGSVPDTSLPMGPHKQGQRRFSLRRIFGGLYLASEKKTAICEVWEAQKNFPLDLYRVTVQADGILDLRPSQVQSSFELSRDCFGLANPPAREHRDYVAWEYLAYAIWSWGFNGVIWKSTRYAGDCLCLYRPGPTVVIGAPQIVEAGIRVPEWLGQNP